MAPKLIILGSSNALPTEDRDHTMLAVVADGETVLVDCGVNPILKLQKMGINPTLVKHLIITHFHPDHVSGFPMFVMAMWLQGRSEKLHVYGFGHSIERLQRMMELFGWDKWPNFYPVEFHTVAEGDSQPVLDIPELAVTGTLVNHFIPTMGIRFHFKEDGKQVGYTCDTEPCHGVGVVADGVDVLLHEATGNEIGHSSAGQAGKAAQSAGVRHLMLVHYSTEKNTKMGLIAEAAQFFTGKITCADDMQVIEIA